MNNPDSICYVYGKLTLYLKSVKIRQRLEHTMSFTLDLTGEQDIS